MKVYIYTETHSCPDERCGVSDQVLFTDENEAFAYYNKKCEEYRNDPDDEWYEDSYSDHATYFNCGNDECELYLNTFEI